MADTGLNVLLLGIQGSGKGTQAARIASEYDLPHVSTGDILRKHVADGSELGRRAGPIMASGALMPDELMVEIVEDRLGRPDTGAGFVLDGFPRTLAQGEALDRMLGGIGRPLSLILELRISDDTARERMLRRAEEQGRADDTPEAIEKRIRGYHELSQPLVDYYTTTGKLVVIHGERSIDEVWAEIQQAIETARRLKDAG